MVARQLAGLGLFALGQAYLATHNPILQVTSEAVSGEFDDLLCLIRGALSFGMCKVYAPMLMPLAAIQIGIGLVLAHEMPFKEYMVIALLFALCAGSTFYNRDVDSETMEQFNKRLLDETKKQPNWGEMEARTPSPTRYNDDLVADDEVPCNPEDDFERSEEEEEEEEVGGQDDKPSASYKPVNLIEPTKPELSAAQNKTPSRQYFERKADTPKISPTTVPEVRLPATPSPVSASTQPPNDAPSSIAPPTSASSATKAESVVQRARRLALEEQDRRLQERLEKLKIKKK